MLIKIRNFCIAAFFAICLFSAVNTALASPICPVPTEVTQPDGTVITVTAYGDEFFSWKEDENGNVIVYDEGTDSYKYAEIKDGKLVPTSETVGDTSLPRSAPQRLQREDVMPLWENAERVDYTQPCEIDSIALMSADGEPEQKKPLTHQKLLVLLVEFNDIPIKFDCDFWYRQMFSTDPHDISVANYWKENANGLDIFEPADTSSIQIGREGLASTEGYDKNYTDVKYRIDGFSDGVVKVTLDMPHPVRTWNETLGINSDKAAALAVRAVETDLDFTMEQPHIAAILAGYDRASYINSDGKGQIHAHASLYSLSTQDGISLGRITVQGERYDEEDAIGIGDICHELGHSVFNLPDLYFNHAIGATPNCGVCSYSLMSSGSSGHRYNFEIEKVKLGEMPTHLDAWSKIQCGFVTPTMVNDWDGNLNSITENGIDSKYNVLEIRSKSDPNQYFLVENRQLIGYDRGLQEVNNYYRGDEAISGGIIIWHIDESISAINNGTQLHHPFMWAERSTNEWSPAKWAYTGANGRNTFNTETTPSSNLHEKKTMENWDCSLGLDCHPQTLKSGISVEVLGENGPSVRVKANVAEEYRVSMVEGATFADLFPDANFCRAVIDNMKEKDGMTRLPDNVLTIRDWATLVSIEELYVDGYGIKDLTGIEYFTFIYALDCSDNEITDLTPISSAQCQNINDLDCSNNKLTELNMSQWVNLWYLWCEDNLLMELDISNNEQLDDLRCSNNLLTELDTSQNSDLRILQCANNRLTGLDLTNNPRLLLLWCYENYMDTETPGNSIKGLESLPKLGSPLWMDDQGKNRFVYYPQKTVAAKHSWESAWQKDDTHHWHNCADADCPIANNADKNGYGEHIWDSGNVTKQPTCSDAGIKTYTCAICQATKIEGIAATGIHTPSEWEIVTFATTKQEGLRVKKCTVCQAELQRETIPKLKPASPGSSISGPSEPAPPDNDPANCSKDENCPLQRYTDISIAAWYHDGIHYCVENGLMNGEGNGRFAPNAALTRGMLAQILYNNAERPAVTGNNPFDDVASGVWYANAVVWAAESGIVSGYGNGSFEPEDSITREQLAVMLWRYDGSPEVSENLDCFTDGNNTSAWAVPAMRWAVAKGVMNGNGDGTITPTGKATRAEVAAVLKNYCEKK